MSQFEEFRKKLVETYPEKDLDISIYRFMEDFFDFNKNPLNGELKENQDELSYDSYGSEDTELKRIFYFSEFSIFVQFSGTRASYEGEEWDEMIKVKPIQKIIEGYEQVNE